MNHTTTDRTQRLIDALQHPHTDVRLKAAMTAGSEPTSVLAAALVRRCAVEADFFVRDMLTWALVQQPVEIVLPLLRPELESDKPLARSQALHTLTKIADRETWDWITTQHLHDHHDEVARTAWRAAVALVPDERAAWLAGELVTELGRGDRDLQRSLGRALICLGAVIEPLLDRASRHEDVAVRAHAAATQRLHQDPDSEFWLTLSEVSDTVIDDPGDDQRGDQGGDQSGDQG